MAIISVTRALVFSGIYFPRRTIKIEISSKRVITFLKQICQYLNFKKSKSVVPQLQNFKDIYLCCKFTVP